MVAEARVLNLWDLSASSIYDTIPSVSYRVFKKEFDNPDDTFIGAFIASFQVEDTTRMVCFYDGKVQSFLDWENKTILVNDFSDSILIRLSVPDKLVEVVGNRIVCADLSNITEDRCTTWR